MPATTKVPSLPVITTPTPRGSEAGCIPGTLVYILSGLYQNISFFTELFQKPSGAVQEAGWRPGVRRGARSEEVPAADLPGGRGGAGGGNQ